MARRKNSKDSIRNIQRSSGSYHISIPIGIMRKLAWKDRQKVIVRLRGKSTILISDWKK